MMQTTSREKTTFAMFGLCAIIGIMSLLVVVYYTSAANLQNNTSNQVANLQAQNNDLERQLEARNAQISSLNSQISSLNSQVTTLTNEKNELVTQVNTVTGQMDVFAHRLAQLEAEKVNPFTYGGSGAHIR